MTRIERWKTTEPVRLYLWTAASVVFVVLGTVAALTGQWPTAGSVAIGLVVVLVLGGEAARASVYSPAGVMAERAAAATRASLQRSLW